MCLLPIDRVVRFITAKLACARAYTSLQGYMNDEKKSPALRFASGSIFSPRPCLRLSGAHCLTAYENDDNTTERLRHKKVDHRILTRCRQRRRLKTPLPLPSRYSITFQNNMNKVILIGNVGRDPERKGEKVVAFSLATTESGYTKQDGTKAGQPHQNCR